MEAKKSLKNKLKSRNLVIAVTLFFTLSSTAQTWSNVRNGTNGYVLALTVYNGNLIAGGRFTMAGGNPANNIAVWNGSSWSALGTGMNNAIHALTVFNGNLYAGGDFTTADGNPSSRIAEWNGSSWSALGAGLQGPSYGGVFGGVFALAGYNGNLYAGGEFDSAGGNPINFIAEWNGTSWSALGSGLNSYSYVYALTVYNGNLYAGGWIDSAGGVLSNSIAEWNGISWSSPGGGLYGPVYALTVYNSNLYAGGQFRGAIGVRANGVAEWNGTSWSGVGTGINWFNRNIDAGVDALISYNGNLYAGGRFDTAGGIPAKNIAQWNGTSWTALGMGVNAYDSAFAVYNGCLYTGGEFDTAGGNSANYIATWCTPTAIDEVNSTVDNIPPYPNPSSTLIHLNYTLPEGIKTAEMIITNISGQIIKTCNIGSTFNDILLDTKQYAPGEYLYYFQSSNYTSPTNKFIINR